MSKEHDKKAQHNTLDREFKDANYLSPSETPLIATPELQRICVHPEDELPMVRFICIICVDKEVPATELMKWDMELQMVRQASGPLPNCVIFGSTSDVPWNHELTQQLLPCNNYTDPLRWTDLNDQGRFAWVDILRPEQICAYDAHLVLRYKNEKSKHNPSCANSAILESSGLPAMTICPPKLTIINYMTYNPNDQYKAGTPPTRALVVNPSASQQGNALGIYTFHIADLYYNGQEITFPESYQQALYRNIQVHHPNGSEKLVQPEEVISNEMRSFCIATARMILDPIVAFHHVTPAKYIENANTAGRPIHTETLDILMTQRARNKIIELRNRFKHVSSRQRYLHFAPRDIFPLLLCQRDEVAALLKVSTTWLKDRIRAFGVTEWPARALMVHSSELRLALLTLRLLLGGPNGIRARVAAGVKITEDVVDSVKALSDTIRKLRHDRFAILKDYLTPEFYDEFSKNAEIWCLDPNWDAPPPWEYTHADHNLGYGFGRLSVVRNSPVAHQKDHESRRKGTDTYLSHEVPAQVTNCEDDEVDNNDEFCN